MGQSAAEKTRGSPERYEAIETAPDRPKVAWWSPNRSSRNQSWGVAPIRSRAKMQVDDWARTRRHRSVVGVGVGGDGVGRGGGVGGRYGDGRLGGG